jgi:xylulokinase
MEYGDTSGMALWNPITRQWSKKVINAIDPALIHKLPPVRPPDQSIGNISSHLVQKFGFSPKCRIDAGSGDNMYGAIGTGNIEPGIVTISLGTSGTAYTFLEKPYIDPSGEIACFCDSTGHYLPLLCVSNLANGYNHVLNQFQLSHDDFDDVIRQSRPGNGGRILLPWYEGERTPDLPLAAPVYFGFKTDDFTREILCRAVLEGHILNLYDGFKKMGVVPKEIRLTGGLANSDAWCQGIADIFESETFPVKGEGAALGAALHAAWVWFKENGYTYSLKDLADSFVVPDKKRKKKPLAENVSVYQHQKKLFTSLSLRIRGYKADDPFKLRIELIH